MTQKKKKASASEDLTVVLLRGNGSPRSFRLSLPALHRSLTAVGFVFATAILVAIVSLGLSFFREPRSRVNSTPPAASTPVAETPSSASEKSEGGLWTQLQGAVKPEKDASETAKELAGLREDLAKLNAKLDGRAEMPNGQSNAVPLQLVGARSTLVPENESVMQIKNAKTVRDPATKQIFLDFELHNTDPNQRQARGHIVVLAKTADFLASYPNGVFTPNQNILINYNRGETFAISRFRQARATFPVAGLEGKSVSYQILLFGSDGRIIANAHVEEK